MNKSNNLLVRAIIFALPIILCLWASKPSYGQEIKRQEVKRQVEIKVLRQGAHEIVSEVKVNERSQFLLTTYSVGVMITAANYTTQTIDDMVVLQEALGLYGVELLPEGHPAAIPHNLREYAQSKFAQSLENLDKIGHYPDLYLLSAIKFTNVKGKTELFFVQTALSAGGTSLFMREYSVQNINLMGDMMRTIGWQQVALFPATQLPHVPAHFSQEFITMCERNGISINDSQSFRTILVSPDYLGSKGV